MIKTGLVIAAFLMIGVQFGFAQQDSTRYINGLPVSEDDTARTFLQQDLDPKNNLNPVSPHSLPSALVRELNKKDQYKGWQDTTVYYDRNTRLFIVPVKTEEGIKIFGLNEKGNPVSYDEVSSKPE